MTPESIDRLKSQLLTSGLSQKDSSLFQVINQLIDAVKDGLIAFQIVSGGGGGGGGGLGGQTFLTWAPEQASLPSSRQVIPGQGIQINQTGTKFIINAVPSSPGKIIITDDNASSRPVGIPGERGLQGLTGPIGPRGLAGECCDGAEGVGPLFGLQDLNQNLVGIDEATTGFTGTGTMTWTSVTVVTYRYILINKLMIVWFDFGPSTVGGVLGIDLKVTIPRGQIAKRTQQTTFIYTDNGTFGLGQMYVAAAGTQINFRKGPGTTWQASAANTFIQGMIYFEVQ